MKGWVCNKCYGRPTVTTDKAAHDFISHVTKTAALQCRLCDHQDVVEADFVDHVFVFHGRRLVSRGAILSCIKTNLPPFERLAHCKQCNLRNASPTIVAYHTHLSRPDPTAPTSTASTVTTTATTATSTVAPLPAPQPTAIIRAPGRLISTGAAAAQPEVAARDEPAAEPEPQPQPQPAPPSEADSDVAERDDDNEDGNDANDDVQVEKVATDSATGGNLIYDEWYDTIAYDTFARRPMLGVHFQVTFFGEVCSRANKPTRRRQIFFEFHVGTGDYVVTDDDGRAITNLDIRPHRLSPEHYAQYYRPTEPSPTYEYEAVLMTTTRCPAVVVYVTYFNEIGSGSYRLARYDDRRPEGCIFIKPVAPRFNVNPSVSVFCFPLFVLSLALVRLATCCLYVFTVRYFSHFHVAFHVIFLATSVYNYMY